MFKKFFYDIKPVLPRSFQLYLRRKLALYKIKRYREVWPIFPGSNKKPENWKGWPDGKQFALVLTHDVEHKRGYDRVLQLMEIEKELGFISSFFFVPERDYKVEPELLKTIKKNGFGIGVHGLHHDGKLFSSEEEFLRRAGKINYYLIEWDVTGFRAPSMHHNLDWIGALNVEFDLSTFDTDPFEPQPDGVATIFPFWVKNKRHKNGGYIELPYTLSQDFTTFILLKETYPKTWEYKTDWLVNNGGMVLVNVHPDYISFDFNGSDEEFPISIYKTFLNGIKERYYDKFWNALPKEVAQYVKDMFYLNASPQIEVNRSDKHN